MKQMEPKIVKIGDYEFYITPFSAFYAANLFGELASFLGPIIAASVSAANKVGATDDGEDVELTEEQQEQVGTTIADALRGIDGDKMEALMRKLIISKGNVVVKYYDTDLEQEVQERLTADLANEIFCMKISDMYMLVVQVIMLNYGSFFGNTSGLFGKATEVFKVRMKN